jgi:hypothetical protein
MLSHEIYTTDWNSDANLKAYYRFESGALITDSSGEGHDLTAISDPAEDTGKFGGAVALDGNDAYSAVDHTDFKPTGNFTVGCWAKSSTQANVYLFESFSLNTNFAGFWLQAIATTGVVRFLSGKNTGTTSNTDYKIATGTTNIFDGNWHFIVGTWDGSYLRLYVDGKLDVAAVAWTNAPAYAATNYVRIGCGNNSGTNISFLTGSVDDVFLINGTALTTPQVNAIYGATKSINGLAIASIKSMDGVAIASVKNFNGLN